MNPQDFRPPSPINDPLAKADPGARLVCEIRRHPVGIAGLYAGVGLLLAVLAIVLFVVAPNVMTDYSRGQIVSIGALIFAGAALITGGLVLVAHVVYWGNRWIVTDESITQVVKTGLFDKQTSQLSLGNLEDLTAEQHGLLAQLFHYGELSAETAAATDKFKFPYCPKPTDYARQILAARDRFEENRRQNEQNGQPAARPDSSQPPSTETGYRVPD